MQDQNAYDDRCKHPLQGGASRGRLANHGRVLDRLSFCGCAWQGLAALWPVVFGVVVAMGALTGCGSQSSQESALSERAPLMDESASSPSTSENSSASPLSSHAVVFLGDSLTDYGSFEQEFANAGALNLGVSGNTTSDVLERLDGVVAAQPSQVFLMIGINDLLRGAQVPEVFEHIQEIVSRLHDELPEATIVIQSLLPTAEPDVNGEVEKLNGELKAFAQQTGYTTYLDIHDLYADQTGALRQELTNDGLHLVPEAYGPWFERIQSEYL